jgi:hypothetical protein
MDGASIAIEQADQHVLRRALARAARTEKSEDLPGFDRETDVANGGALSARIREAERVHFDDGH